jgi:hypothetical protein
MKKIHFGKSTKMLEITCCAKDFSISATGRNKWASRHVGISEIDITKYFS